jgi:hypothetical protein
MQAIHGAAGWIDEWMATPGEWKEGLAAGATGRTLLGPVERTAAFRACIRPADGLNCRIRIKWEE